MSDNLPAWNWLFRRLLLALADDPARRDHRWAWSHFRRRHQALAKQCHTARRARPAVRIADPPRQTLAAPADLTDARWRQIAPLLPPAAATGRTPRDHRTVLAGILWVIRTGGAWGAVPAAFGSGATLYRRYRHWREDGTWTAILAVLLAPDPLPDL